jgi:predicted nucleic acid-binding protein
MYLLDTNVLSALGRPDRAPQVAAWIRGKPDDQLYLSVITLGEIERGIVRQSGRDPAFAADLRGWLERTVRLFADRILPFDADAARIWGGLSARIGNTGADLLIAATALSRNWVVVTGDRAFETTGVRVESPFAG